MTKQSSAKYASGTFGKSSDVRDSLGRPLMPSSDGTARPSLNESQDGVEDDEGNKIHIELCEPLLHNESIPSRAQSEVVHDADGKPKKRKCCSIF